MGAEYACIRGDCNRTYAYAICELLDPDGALFGDRIIAAVDSGGADLSKRLMQARHVSIPPPKEVQMTLKHMCLTQVRVLGQTEL